MGEKRNSILSGKVTVLAVICSLVIGSLAVNTAFSLDGSGTEEDPWRLQSLEDFNEFAADPNYWAGFTRLETDFNLAGQTYSTAVISPDVNNASWFFQGIAFTGVFDGNDHKVKNLTINDGGAGNDYLGLFGYIVGDDAHVGNLGLEGASISGNKYVGGLVGSIFFGSISNCYFIGDVNGVQIVGGLVGFGEVSVTNCYSIGYVNGDVSVGGLIGESVFSGIISNCYSTSDVNGNTYVGGLIASNVGRILNCYSTGDVRGIEWVGGLVGQNWDSISNCYSTGNVNGFRLYGGLLGENQYSISNCFWDTRHGLTEGIGEDWGTAINVLGLPTALMQTKSTFTSAGWDFVDIWLINDGVTYPVLRQEIRSDLNGDGGVNFLDFGIFANQWMQEQ